MKENSYIYFVTGTFLLTVLLLLSSCAHQVSRSTADNPKETVPLSCLVVMPVIVPYQAEQQIPGRRGDLQKGAVYLDSLLKRKLNFSRVKKVLYSETLSTVTAGDQGGRLGIIQQVSKNMGCPYVLVSSMSRFRQRQGGTMAVDEPASAAFELTIIDTATGKSLWGASFNETQASLSENLLSFTKVKSRGFAWITVEELVSVGTDEKLKECPYLY